MKRTIIIACFLFIIFTIKTYSQTQFIELVNNIQSNIDGVNYYEIVNANGQTNTFYH